MVEKYLFWRRKRGVSTTEYAVLMGVIGVLIILTISSIGENVSNMFDRVAGLFDENLTEEVASGGGIPPVIITITPPVDATYGINGFIDFTFIYDKPVSLSGGVPDISIEVGIDGSGVVSPLAYVPAESTSTELVFRYIVQNGDVDADGIELISTAINLNGGTLVETSAPATSANLDFTTPTPNLDGVLIGDDIPTITALILPEDGYYRGGDVLNFGLRFSRSVIFPPLGGGAFPGVVNLQFEIDGPPMGLGFAGYASGDGDSEVLMPYTVGSNNTDTDGINITKLNVSNTPVASNDNLKIADMTLPVALPLQTGIILDTDNPNGTVVFNNVGSFSVGETVSVTVNFDEPVMATSGAFLPIIMRASPNNNDLPLQFSHNAGASTATSLVFDYVVTSSVVTSHLTAYNNHSSGHDWASLAASEVTDLAGNPSNLASSSYNTTDIIIYGPEVNFVLAPNIGGDSTLRLSQDGSDGSWHSMQANNNTSTSIDARVTSWVGNGFAYAGNNFSGFPLNAAFFRSATGIDYTKHESLAIGNIVDIAGTSSRYVMLGLDGSSNQNSLAFTPSSGNFDAPVLLPTTGMSFDLLWIYSGSSFSESLTGGFATGAVGVIDSIAGNGNILAAVGSESSIVYSTDNGQSWSAAHINGLIDSISCSPSGGGTSCSLIRCARRYEDVAFGNNRFVAVARHGGGCTPTNYITVSYAGSAGPIATTGDPLIPPDVSYSGSGTSMVLGQSWIDIEESHIPANPEFSDVAFGGGKFYAGGSGPSFYSSTDGIDWTAHDVSDIVAVSGTDWITNIAYSGAAGGVLVVTTFTNEYRSIDGGNNWEEINIFNTSGADDITGRP